MLYYSGSNSNVIAKRLVAMQKIDPKIFPGAHVISPSPGYIDPAISVNEAKFHALDGIVSQSVLDRSRSFESRIAQF